MFQFELFVISAMIAFNSIFAAYEIALASIHPGRLQALVNDGRRGARAALQMKQRMEASLAVVQLGITLVGAIAAATGGAGAEEMLEPVLLDAGFSRASSEILAIALVVAPLTIFTIILGELVPKVFALRNKEWVCLKLSPPMRWFSYAVWPAVWFLETVVRGIVSWGKRGGTDDEDSQAEGAIQELHAAAALARMSRLIGQREQGIIVSASRLASTPLRRIMLPAEYIGMVTIHQSLSEALIAAHQEMHTRFPVTEVAGDPQRIIGYVNFKDLVAALRLMPQAPTLRNLMRSIHSFPADHSVADALEWLIRQHNHIALVREPNGHIIGMITLEDIVEELVGEIHDEFDRIPAHLTAAGPGWIAGGFVPLGKIHEVTGIELKPRDEKPIHTLNDWIVEHLGRPPRGGDSIECDEADVLVRKVRNVLVQEAFLRPRSNVDE